MIDIGDFNFATGFALRSHGWGEGVSRNMLKMAVLAQRNARSRTTPHPFVGAVENDVFIRPDDGSLWVLNGGQWYTFAPRLGALFRVADEGIAVAYLAPGAWAQVADLQAAYPSIERSLSVYVRGAIPPNDVLFDYVPAIEFVIPAGAPGSIATLETPPSATLVLTIGVALRGYTNYGQNPEQGEPWPDPEFSGFPTITFDPGSSVGRFFVPRPAHVYPSDRESDRIRPDFLRIVSPAASHGATGLRVTLRGFIEGME